MPSTSFSGLKLAQDIRVFHGRHWNIDVPQGAVLGRHFHEDLLGTLDKLTVALHGFRIGRVDLLGLFDRERLQLGVGGRLVVFLPILPIASPLGACLPPNMIGLNALGMVIRGAGRA